MKKYLTLSIIAVCIFVTVLFLTIGCQNKDTSQADKANIPTANPLSSPRDNNEDINMVKNGQMEFDQSITVGQATEGYKYFGKKEWATGKDTQGRSL